MRILIVEDMKQSRYLLHNLLTHEGYDVSDAENGREALEKLEKSEVDLIISDILMPVMNGFRFCQTVKSNEKWQALPFIFYTATFVDPEDEKLALSLGAARFIIKPTDNNVFLRIIKEVLTGYKAGAQFSEFKNGSELENVLTMYENSITKKLDATVYKLREKQLLLEKSEKRLKEAQELGHIGHWEMDLGSRKISWSDEVFRIFGFKPQEFEPDLKKYLAFIHPEDRQRVAEKIQELLQKKKELQFRFRIMTQSGQLRYVNQLCQTQYDEEGNAAYHIGTLQDMTEITNAEQENLKQVSIIMQTQKLKAMGEMAAGIIHDINQPLTSMIINAQLMKQSLKSHSGKPEELIEHTDVLEHSSIKIRNLMEQLRAFSRQQNLQRKDRVDINLCIHDTLKLFDIQTKQHDINLEIQLTENIPTILGNPFLIEQVVFNLLSNAKDALLEQRKESNVTRVSNIKVTTAVDKGYIFVTVEDNGVGISEESIAKVFDPFFTTKTEEAGTGLGLFVTRSIIKSLQGEITVESIPQQYTRFIITIPANQ